MDINNKYEFTVILNFIKHMLFMLIVIPITYLTITNAIFVYLPCRLLSCRIHSKIVYILVNLIMLSISFFSSNYLWTQAFFKLRIFAGETYMSTMKELNNMRYKFPVYMKFLNKVTNVSSFINSKDHLAGLIGIIIDWIILFCIYNPFKGLMV